jgi:O-antigen ligase
MALALAIQPLPFLRFCRETPIVWVVLLLTTYIGVRTLWATQEFPETAETIVSGGNGLLLLTGIPALALAWHLGQDPRRGYALIALYLLGLVAGVLYQLGWGNFWEYLTGSTQNRLFFGGHSNAIGTFYATGVLGALALGLGLFGRIKQHLPTAALIMLTAFLALAGALSLMIVFWNQSRTVWIALLGAVLFMGATGLPRLAWVRDHLRPTIFLGGASLIFAAGWIISANLPLIEKRVQAAAAEIRTMANAQEIAPASEGGSLRTRYWMVKSGLEAVEERPVFGWGPDTYQLVEKNLGYNSLLKWEQIHNLYIQLAVEFGLAGLMAFAVFLGLLARELYLAFKDGDLPPSLAAFAGSSWTFFLILSLAQIRHDDPQGKAYLILLTGLALTGAVVRRLPQASRTKRPGDPAPTPSPNRETETV